MKAIKLQHIDAMLASSKVEEHIFHGKEFHVCYRLPSGFTVTGVATVADPANFKIVTARAVARKNAEDKLLELEAYRAAAEDYRSIVLDAVRTRIARGKATASGDDDLDEPLPERTCSIDGEPCGSCE